MAGCESTTAVCCVAEAEMGGSKIRLDFAACGSLPKCPDLSKGIFK